MTEIEVTVTLALPDEALRVRLSLPAHSSVADAISASNLDQHPAAPRPLAGYVGIWNQPCELSQTLCHGDRIELYRPLTVDPMVARRRRAARRLRLNQ